MVATVINRLITTHANNRVLTTVHRDQACEQATSIVPTLQAELELARAGHIDRHLSPRW